MKFQFTTIGAALALQVTLSTASSHRSAHERLHNIESRHRHAKHHARQSPAETGSIVELRSEAEMEKRDGQCQFPSSAGLVAVTSQFVNAGWAMSPDQKCTPGTYCPYACPPGQMMAQWDPQATSYSPGVSMRGGLYCDNNGNVQKPFPNKPYCMTGSTNIIAQDTTGKGTAFCQTVLPGNEAMIIPTLVQGSQTLAIPTTEYWCKTAAQYYINTPGLSTSEACVWSDGSKPLGNWAPYTAGGNTVDDGNTFLMLGWNPIWLEPHGFHIDVPNFGVEILCDGPGCNGLPCSIDPAIHGKNEMTGGRKDGGKGDAGGANSCVVTVPSGVNARYVVFAPGQAQSAGKIPVGAMPKINTPAPAAAPPAPPAPASSSTLPPKPSTTSTTTSTSTTTTSTEATTTSDSSASTTTSVAYSPHMLIENNSTDSSNSMTSGDAAPTTTILMSTTGSSASAIAAASSSTAATANAGIKDGPAFAVMTVAIAAGFFALAL